MASINKSIKREQKQFKNKHGMRVSGKSAFLLQQCQIKRAEQANSKTK